MTMYRSGRVASPAKSSSGSEREDDEEDNVDDKLEEDAAVSGAKQAARSADVTPGDGALPTAVVKRTQHGEFQ
jgi:hypothetical protein